VSAHKRELDVTLQVVDRRIDEIVAGSDELVLRYLSKVSKNRGKMFRPQLMIAFANLLGGAPREALITCAACCELLHTASLIHDDVIDEADQRRGQPTLNHHFGNEVAVIVGDYIFALLYQELLALRDFELMTMINDTSQLLGLGVLSELANRNNFKLNLDTYYDLMFKKTAALFGLCSSLGAYLAKAELSAQRAAQDYGKELGLGFQIVDDLLDITADSISTGKPVLNDLREGRITIPLIYAYAQEPEATRRLVLEFQQAPTTTAAEAVKTHLVQTGAIQHAYDLARASIAKARDIARQLASEIPAVSNDGVLQQVEDRVIDVLAPQLAQVSAS